MKVAELIMLLDEYPGTYDVCYTNYQINGDFEDVEVAHVLDFGEASKPYIALTGN